MKVFKFDPKTGKRGELIDDIRRPSTFGQSIEFAQSQGVQTHLIYQAVQHGQPSLVITSLHGS